ncbi:hypothetical protein BD310DRAFT_941131 [Dichomitus squalens]|uniref:Uncharacterized protein n=1 Tax=Dichomitus squalens TaxID=114155 RepID=A0A4Q9PFY2_9APHY|nr:hypothetical protein BD310DRAFT_941131 [Dichomitus squalens]
MRNDNGYETIITEHLGYPMRFYNHEGFVFPACQGPYEEYPVLQGKVFGVDRPAPPGPHRVVYEYNGRASVYCGKCCVTHANAPTRRGYLQCT